jgi:nascent polypeptide-associated complex subunit alpha
MMPGMNPRQVQAMMKQMGMQQVDVPAEQVIIRTADKDIVIDNPQVARVTMMGQQTYQITGAAREEKRSVTYVPSEEDVATVAEQAGVAKELAQQALVAKDGDIAEAILSLQ